MQSSARVSRTDEHPLPGPDTATVGGAGRELGPAGELAVILAWDLAGLGDRWHGNGGPQALPDVHLPTILLPTRDSCWGGGNGGSHFQLFWPLNE